MSESVISHPSMRRTKKSDAPTQKSEVFTIDDASAANISSVSYEAGPHDTGTVVQPQPQVAKGPTRNILEELLFIGRATKSIDISGIKFEVSTLTQKESTALMKHLFNLTGDGADVFVMRSLTMSFALKSVNGVLLEDLETDEEFASAQDKKLAIIDKMQRSVVEKLHDEYLELSEESEKVVGEEELKNS
jgi:hypothetical protein